MKTLTVTRREAVLRDWWRANRIRVSNWLLGVALLALIPLSVLELPTAAWIVDGAVFLAGGQIAIHVPYWSIDNGDEL